MLLALLIHSVRAQNDFRQAKIPNHSEQLQWQPHCKVFHDSFGLALVPYRALENIDSRPEVFFSLCCLKLLAAFLKLVAFLLMQRLSSFASTSAALSSRLWHLWALAKFEAKRSSTSALNLFVGVGPSQWPGSECLDSMHQKLPCGNGLIQTQQACTKHEDMPGMDMHMCKA